jgi:hypothetical protein
MEVDAQLSAGNYLARVRAALRAAAWRLARPRRFALSLACRDRAEGDAAAVPSRFNAFKDDCDRFIDRGVVEGD